MVSFLNGIFLYHVDLYFSIEERSSRAGRDDPERFPTADRLWDHGLVGLLD